MKSFDELFNQVFSEPLAESEQFKQGKADCENGLPCNSDNHDYLQGYSAQYELLQKKARVK